MVIIHQAVKSQLNKPAYYKLPTARGGSRQEKASVRLPCLSRAVAYNVSSAYAVKEATRIEL